MGFRMDVIDAEHPELKYSETKLFGYFEGKGLRSYQYLLSKGKIEGDEIFDYGLDLEIELTAEEFREFIDLYNADYMDAWHNAPGWNITEGDYEQIDALKSTKSKKIISWG